MVRFKTLDDWFEGYATLTIQNVYRGLNEGGIFATNTSTTNHMVTRNMQLWKTGLSWLKKLALNILKL